MVTSKMKQLQKRNSFIPVRIEDLYKEQKHQPLALLMLLKEKQDGTIEGHGVSDRIKQRETFEPNNITVTTVSIEAVILNTTIDALEGRYMAVVDLPGSYLSA